MIDQLKKPENCGLLCFQTQSDHHHILPPMPSAAADNRISIIYKRTDDQAQQRDLKKESLAL